VRELSLPILREIGSIARTIVARSDVAFKAYRLQKGQFVFLTRVCENPGTNLARLSDLARVDKTTTTKAVQKLVSLGYLDTERDELDGRSQRLSPTEKGLVVYDALIKEENGLIDSCLRGFSPEEIDAVGRYAARLRENLDELWFGLKKRKEGANGEKSE